jgi:hypothetical protein
MHMQRPTLQGCKAKGKAYRKRNHGPSARPDPSEEQRADRNANPRTRSLRVHDRDHAKPLSAATDRALSLFVSGHRRKLENTEVIQQVDLIRAVLFFIVLVLLMILFSFVLRELGVDTEDLDRRLWGRERLP